MNEETIEVRLYDGDYVKLFQAQAKLNSKKSMLELKKLLQQKGVSLVLKKEKKEEKDIDFF